MSQVGGVRIAQVLFEKKNNTFFKILTFSGLYVLKLCRQRCQYQHCTSFYSQVICQNPNLLCVCLQSLSETCFLNCLKKQFSLFRREHVITFLRGRTNKILTSYFEYIFLPNFRYLQLKKPAWKVWKNAHQDFFLWIKSSQEVF